jgi:hypothetical protein
VKPHEPGHPILAEENMISAERSSDSWTSICVPALLMDLSNSIHKSAVFHVTTAYRPIFPPVIAAARHFQRPAHDGHPESVLMASYEPEPIALGLEKMAKAFF